MAKSRLSRRQAVYAAGAALLCAPSAQAVAIFDAQASRLKPLSDPPYVPPRSIGAVADIYSRMTAGVRVEGRGPYDFIVDTGANQSVISAEIVASLGLPVNPSAPLNGVAGVMMAPTTFAVLDIAGRRKAGAGFSVLPGAAIGGQGMLGLDQLGGQRLTLDFRNPSIRIETAGRLWNAGRDVVVRGRQVSGQLTLVDADIAGLKITAFIDSGAQSSIGNMALRDLAADRNRAIGAWATTSIVSATGQTIEAELANLPNLRLGGVKMPNWPVAFADLHTFRMWNLVDRPAILIGVDILSRFESVSLDFFRSEVRFRLPSDDGALVGAAWA
jgi:predicted aspartyl protease